MNHIAIDLNYALSAWYFDSKLFLISLYIILSKYKSADEMLHASPDADRN